MDWELVRVEGVSATGEKYEFPFRSEGEAVPLGYWVCKRGGSGIGNRGGRPEESGPEPLPPVADLARRLVLDAFRLIENSEYAAVSLINSSSASYSS